MEASLQGNDISMSVHVSNTHTHKEEEDEEYEETCKRYEELKSTLVKGRGWMSPHLVKYQGFWFTPNSGLKAVVLLQNHFKAHPNDICLASSPKTGTTWLKSLVFTTLNRSLYDSPTHPLLSTATHGLFPFLDLSIDQQVLTSNSELDDHDSSPPRLFSTHIPCPLLPKSITASACKTLPKVVGEVTEIVTNSDLHVDSIADKKNTSGKILPKVVDEVTEVVANSNLHGDSIADKKKTSGCKIVYICRDPKDVLISKWVFMNKLRPKDLDPLSLQEAFELFCEGVSHYGPYWDHVLGYWQMSLEFPEKVLFLKFEEMKREPLVWVRVLGEFLGQTFSKEEEEEGVVQKMCSFESLSNLDANRSTIQVFNEELNVENSHFFRKGEVGDWKNHLTPHMVQTLDRISHDKFGALGVEVEAHAHEREREISPTRA